MQQQARDDSGAATHAGRGRQSGFSMIEFLLSTLILMVVSGAVFSMMSETQKMASYQAEVQSVMENSRIAMNTVERFVRQAGNDPLERGFPGVTITSATEVRLRSDLTGSLSSDTGDPDGDTNDSGEDVIIRYNAGARSLELVPAGGQAQTIANYISAFDLQYLDENSAGTTVGADVRKIRITLSGATTVKNPQTKKIYGLQLTSDLQLATRQ